MLGGKAGLTVGRIQLGGEGLIHQIAVTLLTHETAWMPSSVQRQHRLHPADWLHTLGAVEHIPVEVIILLNST